MHSFISSSISSFNTVKEQFFKLKIYRYLFWVFFLFIINRLIGADTGFEKNLLPALLFTVIHIMASYINIYLFIPFLLYKRRYLYYLLVTGLTILFFCFPLAILTNTFFLDNKFLAANIWTPMFFFINSMYLLLTVSITSFFHIFSEWYSQDRENKSLQELNISNELKLLKAQINPHFLFNSLNGLYALTLSKSDKAPEMVMSLSNILRYLLYESSESKVPLEREVEYLNDLINLEKIRMGDRMSVDFQVNGDISAIMIEPFLFINFVENSIKHGVSAQNEKSWIHILLKVENDHKKLYFEIENSMPDENKTQKNEIPGGIGLQNIKKRLKLLYPNKHTLDITENNGTYSVILKLDLK